MLAKVLRHLSRILHLSVEGQSGGAEEQIGAGAACGDHDDGGSYLTQLAYGLSEGHGIIECISPEFEHPQPTAWCSIRLDWNWTTGH